MADPNKAALLKTLKAELMKTKYFFDGSGRNTYIVQAPAAALNGAVALVTKFTYTGAEVVATSEVEYEGQWDSSWDVVQDTPS